MKCLKSRISEFQVCPSGQAKFQVFFSSFIDFYTNSNSSLNGLYGFIFLMALSFLLYCLWALTYTYICHFYVSSLTQNGNKWLAARLQISSCLHGKHISSLPATDLQPVLFTSARPQQSLKHIKGCQENLVILFFLAHDLAC